MRVEHYDSDTRQLRVLLEDALPQNDPQKMFTYWRERLKNLKTIYINMPPTKERQKIALDRDRAQAEFNRWRNLLLASRPR